jgi:ligand-binding sensor domain-containing protein
MNADFETKKYPCLQNLRRLWIKTICLILFLNLHFSVSLIARTDDIKFERISIEHGLSHSCVQSILQDSRGFMWFGTENGLNKYDGYRFKVYWYEPDNPHSLSHNFVRVIHEDRMGILWIGTEGGLNKFDRKTEKFTRYQNDPENPHSLSENRIMTIHEDRSGILWIGTEGGGLNKFVLSPTLSDLQGEAEGFDPGQQRKKFTRYQNDPDDPHSLSENRVMAILEDHAGTLWIGTYGGINKFDRETQKFIRYQSNRDDPHSLSSNSVWSIYEDPGQPGVLWIGTYGRGLNKFDWETGRFTHYFYDPNDPHSLSNNEVWSIYEDRQGMLWIGTLGGGVSRMSREDRERGKFTRYQFDQNDPNSLSHNEVATIYEDKSGVLWIGTFGGGLNKFNRKKEQFHFYRSDPNNPNSLSSSYISCFCEDETGALWIGTYGGGANRFDKETRSFKRYRSDPDDPHSLSNDFVNTICKDRAGKLWFGTQSGGFSKFDKKTDSFRRYPSDPRDPNGMRQHHIHTLLEDHTGAIWIGTLLGGLYRFDREDNTFTPYRHELDNPYSLSSDWINSIYEDRSGVLWIGTRRGGLNKMDRETDTFTRYQYNPNDTHSLSHNEVTVIYEDWSGVIWIGTQWGGLNKLDRESDTFTRYQYDPGEPYSFSHAGVLSIYEDPTQPGVLWIGTEGGGLSRMSRDDRENETFTHYRQEDGLSSDFIHGILQDHHGNLWLSTTKGISRFNPKTETFKKYDVSDGLQGNEFYAGACFKSSSGEMFFGGRNGFNAFHPDSIKENPYIPPIVITDFRLFNKSILPSENSALRQHISETEEIVLSYQDNVFSFEFAALNFINPEKNQYMYQMEGFDRNWIYSGTRRFATYTNLDPGQYIFKVKGSNNDGVWNEEGASVKITITPPIWATWWFRTLSFLLVVGVVFTWYQRRLKNVRMKTELQAAHDAQMSIMPQSDPAVEGFDISGICIPANEVGGDFFDYIWLNEEKTKFCIAIGDVSGKAMKSAMTAVMSSGMIYSNVDKTNSIKEIMTRLNRPVYSKTDRTMFTALCLAALDLQTKELIFTNAGLNEPLLKSDGSVSPVESMGPKFPLGGVKDIIYQERKVQLKPGDVLILFTDGIPEAQNHVRTLYGENTLKSLLENMETSTFSAKEIKEKIIEDVKRFSGSTLQYDDMTVVVVKIT